MKTPKRTLLISIIVAALCALLVAVVNAAPAAPTDVITISKTVSSQVIDLNYRGVLTYTITVTNTNTPGVLNGFVRDTLPTLLSFGQMLEQPTVGTTTVTGDTILWTGIIPAPSGANLNVLTFVFTANLPSPESMSLLLAENHIANTAEAGHMDGTLYVVEVSDTAITRIRRYIYLPLVMRNFAQ